ncbi:MAG: hypothetical protein K2P69_03680 [Eubacterium sp.]|nr:hypothetical protein [Eubacterium sp.]
MNVLQNVSVNTTTTMSDGTQKMSTTTDGIQYVITYQLNPDTVETTIMLTDSTDLFIADIGTYRITYQYADEKGNMVQRTRTIWAEAPNYMNSALSKNNG